MAINLLPVEEKQKSKSEKRESVTHIEMTGPGRLKKEKPRIKSGGVLGFFKQAFQKPKPQEKQEDFMFPEKKKIQKTSSTFPQQEQPADSKKEKVVVYKKPPKEEAPPMKRKKPGIFKKVATFFSKLFSPAAKSSSGKTRPATPKEGYPKYKPVKAEKVHEKNGKPLPPPEVVKVTTKYTEPAPEPERMSIRPEKPAPVPVVTERSPQAEREPSLKPHPKEESVTPRKIELESPLQRKPKKKEKKQKQAPKPKTEKKPSKFFAMIKKWWHSLKNIFTRKKHPAVPPPPVEEAVEPDKAKKKEDIRKYSLEQTPTPVALPEAESAQQKKADQMPPVESLQKEIVHQEELAVPPPPPPPADTKKPTDSPEPEQAEEESADMKLTKPQEPDTGAQGIDWEVNLIPEDAVEVRIPFTRFLYLMLFVIVAAGVVFGGWLWANWYYNTITTEISEVNQEISITEIRINQYEEMTDEVKSMRQKIDNVTNLLDKHVYWSSIFAKLEAYTTADVYYTSMTSDVNGSLVLSAVGKDYNAAIRQFKIFERAHDFVTGVSMSDVAFVTADDAEETLTYTDNPRVRFTMSLVVEPTLYYYPQ